MYEIVELEDGTYQCLPCVYICLWCSIVGLLVPLKGFEHAARIINISVRRI